MVSLVCNMDMIGPTSSISTEDTTSYSLSLRILAHQDSECTFHNHSQVFWNLQNGHTFFIAFVCGVEVVINLVVTNVHVLLTDVFNGGQCFFCSVHVCYSFFKFTASQQYNLHRYLWLNHVNLDNWACIPYTCAHCLLPCHSLPYSD